MLQLAAFLFGSQFTIKNLDSKFLMIDVIGQLVTIKKLSLGFYGTYFIIKSKPRGGRFKKIN